MSIAGNRRRARHIAAAGAVAVLTIGGRVDGQAHGRVVEVTVHGRALEGNILGVAADRAVAVYLPPSYDRSGRRYPVVYLLHGIQDTRAVWTQPWGPPHEPHPGFDTIARLMDAGIAAGTLREMIVVMPDADPSCHYTDGPVKGGWGTYVARDLVGYVDSHYRTVPNAGGRAVLGHSMGGHGAIKLAMTHPGTFAAVYALNPSLLGWGGDVALDNPQIAAAARLRSADELASANFYTQAVIGVGQCFAPDPSAPLLTSLPVSLGTDGRTQEGPGFAQWVAQMPTAMARPHVAALRALKGLAFDSGSDDEFTHIPPTARAFADTLRTLGVAHEFEVYAGDHRNRLWGETGRLYARALPFASRLVGGARATAAEITAAESSRSGDPATAAGSAGRANVPEGAGSSIAGTPLPTRADAAPTTGNQVKLWEAARSGDIRAATSAIAAGADVNGLDFRGPSSGRRPLQYAAENDRAEMIRLLVARGANVKAVNVTGFTALHHAAEAGAAKAAEALLAAGADPGATLPSGSTPLRIARQRGRLEVVRLLEKAAPPPERRSAALSQRTHGN